MDQLHMSMTYSDLMIRPKLLSLTQQQGSVTARDVSKVTGIPHPTVKTSIRRLLDNGHIKRQGRGRRWGYSYYVPDNA